MMITKSSFLAVVQSRLSSKNIISVDTETTGLRAYNGDHLFAVVIADESSEYYFDFKDTLPREWIKNLRPLFRNKTLVMANAKFDMHMLAQEGLDFEGSDIWDVLTIAKCINNTHMKYSLDTVAARAGFEKLSTVEEYIKKHRLQTIVQIPGKKTRSRHPHYDKVPLEVMQPYAERDARITYDLFHRQYAEVSGINREAETQGQPAFWPVIHRECEVTKVCWELERKGMGIDSDFIGRAIEHEERRIGLSKDMYRLITGVELIDSNKALANSFGSLGVAAGKTEKGNASFTDDVLSKIDHPLAETIREYRDASKRANTYYRSFLHHADEGGTVHPNIRQCGADSFRFSITDPALQTLNAEETGEYKVRDSFRARTGFSLLSVDYKAQEYRLTADYSGDLDLISRINAGIDVHTATAELVGVDRQKAKTLNFALLYGAGVARLAEMLKVTPAEAKALKYKYFDALPKISQFIRAVTRTAESRGYIFNWAGRRLYFPDPKYAYKATNYLIQSSGAEIMRCALVELEKFLRPYKTKILLSIHDEILFELSTQEYFLVHKIQDIMVSVYKPRNGLAMSTSVAIGETWGNMRDFEGFTE